MNLDTKIKIANDREYKDDHLTTEERKKLLTEMGISFTDDNVDDVFVNEVLE